MYGGAESVGGFGLVIENKNFKKLSWNVTSYGNGANTIIKLYGLSSVPTNFQDVKNLTPFYENKLGSVSSGYNEEFEIEVASEFKYLFLFQQSGTYTLTSHISAS